jgi:hypothetical protein
MRIKALDWQQPACKRGYIAVTPVGQFAVFDEGDPRWAFSLRGGYTYYHVDTFKEAKRAATAYYEKRVLSMIETEVA